MATYNRTFDLDIRDVEMIEEALRARGRELATMRLALNEEDPANLNAVRVITEDIRAGEDLLGRLHNQKVFYRPKAAYVSG